MNKPVIILTIESGVVTHIGSNINDVFVVVVDRDILESEGAHHVEVYTPDTHLQTYEDVMETYDEQEDYEGVMQCLRFIENIKD